MIVGFTVENWKSFKNTTTISWVARDINVHETRIQSVDRIGIRMLPIVALYGGNASGKTNLIEALKFAQLMIVNGATNEGTIPTIPFLFGEEENNNPTKFKFELLIDELFYRYQFSLTDKVVLEETLKRVEPDNTEILLFNRKKQEVKFSPENIYLTARIADIKLKSNELLLHKAQLISFEQILPIFGWFRDSLRIIFPDMKLHGLHEVIEENGMHLEALNEALYFFDTGISSVEIAKLAPDMAKNLMPNGKILTDLLNDQLSCVMYTEDNALSVRMNNGKPDVYKFMSNRYVSPQKTVRFGLHLESEGTKRLLDLLPSFLNLTSDSKMEVLVIDELDRSMYPELVVVLLKKYLATINNQTRRQLIFTTHDISLLDHEILRRDEIWVTERKSEDISKIYSFGDFIDIEENEKISELYKSGVLGGKPHILFKHSTTNPFLDPEQHNED